jgi:hypothetical protein
MRPNKLIDLAEEISEGSNRFYIPAPSRVLEERLSLLRKVYWIRSVKDCNFKPEWTEVYKLCDFPLEHVRPATKAQTGTYYNIRI